MFTSRTQLCQHWSGLVNEYHLVGFRIQCRHLQVKTTYLDVLGNMQQWVQYSMNRSRLWLVACPFGTGGSLRKIAARREIVLAGIWTCGIRHGYIFGEARDDGLATTNPSGQGAPNQNGGGRPVESHPRSGVDLRFIDPADHVAGWWCPFFFRFSTWGVLKMGDPRSHGFQYQICLMLWLGYRWWSPLIIYLLIFFQMGGSTTDQVVFEVAKSTVPSASCPTRGSRACRATAWKFSGTFSRGQRGQRKTGRSQRARCWTRASPHSWLCCLPHDLYIFGPHTGVLGLSQKLSQCLWFGLGALFLLVCRGCCYAFDLQSSATEIPEFDLSHYQWTLWPRKGHRVRWYLCQPGPHCGICVSGWLIATYKYIQYFSFVILDACWAYIEPILKKTSQNLY